jgi:hypothetical protein
MDQEAENAAVLAALERACQRARELSTSSGHVPLERAETLQRTQRGLQVAHENRLDWQQFSAKITRFSGWWDEMARLVEVLRKDEDVELIVGFDPDVGMRAQTLWRGILDPLLQQYRLVHDDWTWNPDTALELVKAWRQAQNRTSYGRQTLAPLHNCKSMADHPEIEPGLAIRQFTDEDRNELWRAFGAEHSPGPINPTIPDLEAWETVIDYRWKLPRKPPLSDEHAVKVIRDTVRALRLHHPGVTGTTIVWHRPDPSEVFPERVLGSSLFAPLGTGPGLFMDRFASQVGPNCGGPIRVLLQALKTAEKDKGLNLAIRRFDAAYLRLDPEDRLIDLWIAFEALLLPDVSGELSYRAAMRMAQLVGRTADETRSAFKSARRSYTRRSQVVHGEPAKDDLGKVVEETRELARKAIRSWLLDAPDTIGALDDAIFSDGTKSSGD